ncbi:MAG: sugar transferase [Candidatus Aquicultor sp.]|nr:sugar transferase [Candidatus Aquicultor sp.]
MLKFKRLADFCMAVLGLIVLSPFLCILAALVRLYIGSPVLFRQVRPGLNGRYFTLSKFRTMSDARDREGNLLPDAQRLTKFGSFLRSSSLDELPELLNVLKGEMSIVGPRPLLVEYLDRYSPEQARRHEVRPGVTGWAQINGRNAITWDNKFVLDVWYVDNWTVWLDVKIIALTILAVFKRQDINAEGSATMPTFLGSEKEQA